MIDLRGQTVYVNTRMAEMLGLTPPEMVKRPFLDWVVPEDIDPAQLLFANALKAPKSLHLRLKRKNAPALSVHVHGTPLLGVSDTLLGMIATVNIGAGMVSSLEGSPQQS
jgi:PAS domain S-box-containing protein